MGEGGRERGEEEEEYPTLQNLRQNWNFREFLVEYEH
jgi:hypothetical protein